MGIVKISEDIHNQLREASSVFDRSLNSQAEHWIKIGMLSELHPAINYEEIRDLLFKYKNLTIEEILKKSKK
ncbi:ParD-like family protein [Halobacteriovorax sp.]|uniref:ParD-like family protein n=1 Tax=Halobacteriovorax sp. TaxID=2020862 RepID=UPI0035620192